MNEQFSTTVDLSVLQRALATFEIDAGVVPVKVRLTIDDHATLTIKPCTPEPVEIQGEA